MVGIFPMKEFKEMLTWRKLWQELRDVRIGSVIKFLERSNRVRFRQLLAMAVVRFRVDNKKALRGSRRGVWVVSQAAEEPFDANKVLNDALKDFQEAWVKTEDKLALGTLGFSTFLLVWASIGIVKAIDRLPLLPSFFELVGVVYSTWFAYKYLLFKLDREELQKKADKILNRIIGSSDVTDTF
ncbi:hypothetical protein L7F22_061119 [Adiantum nelumboides]|nr:hypothetical protein [Adiantum nelumboides]